MEFPLSFQHLRANASKSSNQAMLLSRFAPDRSDAISSSGCCSSSVHPFSTSSSQASDSRNKQTRKNSMILKTDHFQQLPFASGGQQFGRSDAQERRKACELSRSRRDRRVYALQMTRLSQYCLHQRHSTNFSK